MTSTTIHAPTTAKQAADAGQRSADGAGTAIDGVVSAGRAALDDLASRLPDAASATRQAFSDVEERINAGSDPMVAFGAALSFGFVAGLVVGGANRLLVAAALLPAATFGSSLVERLGRAR